MVSGAVYSVGETNVDLILKLWIPNARIMRALMMMVNVQVPGFRYNKIDGCI